jgi:hypothetical protein
MDSPFIRPHDNLPNPSAAPEAATYRGGSTGFSIKAEPTPILLPASSLDVAGVLPTKASLAPECADGPTTLSLDGKGQTPREDGPDTLHLRTRQLEAIPGSRSPLPTNQPQPKVTPVSAPVCPVQCADSPVIANPGHVPLTRQG